MAGLTPLEHRLDEANAPGGAIAQSGVEAFKEALAGQATAFARWRQEPMTRLALRALQSFVVHPPVRQPPDDLLVQYGVTQGLLLAMQLLTDPSTLWPGVFGGSSAAVSPVPEMDFETPIDEALGQTK